MLRANDLVKRYGDRVALDGLSLHVPRGEVFGLLGPNGAGKTTFVGITLGLLGADSGRVELDGEPITRRHLGRIGVATQELALYDELTGDENLRFFARLQGLHGTRLRERVDLVLDFTGLTDRRRTRVATWSGGMKRRLNLAVALIHDPDLLLLDEPTVGVDPQSRARILEGIGELKGAGKTVLYTTHYMEEAEAICDRVGIIDHGTLLDVGTVPDLLARHGGHERVVATLDDGEEQQLETDDPVAELARLRDQGGLREFRVERPDLQQVFLHLTGRQLRD